MEEEDIEIDIGNENQNVIVPEATFAQTGIPALDKALSGNKVNGAEHLDIHAFKDTENPEPIQPVLTSLNVATLSQYLKNMHHLKILNLNHQRFEVEETELLMDGLKQCQELEELYLSCCQLGDGGAKLLAESISKWKNLKVLNINHDNINVFTLTIISEALKFTKKFEKLIVSENNLNPLPINETFEIFGNLRNMKYIDLSNNHFDPISACSLSKALSQCLTLEGFIFNNEYLTDEMGICEVIIAISKIPTMKIISFTNCRIKLAVVDYVVAYLAKMTSLESINLSDNPITDTGTRLFIRFLNQFQNLSEFYYANTSITKSSAVAIMNLAKECKKTKIIDLSRNDIGDEPFAELPYTYTEYPSLEKLIIDKTNITTETNEIFSTIIADWRNFKYLSMKENPGIAKGNESLIELTKSIRYAKQMDYFNVSNITLTFEQALALGELHKDYPKKTIIFNYETSCKALDNIVLLGTLREEPNFILEKYKFESENTIDYIASIIPAMKNLASLSLAGCIINPNILQSFQKITASCRNIAALSFSNCDLMSHQVNIIISIVGLCSNLRNLSLSQNHLFSNDITKICKEIIVYCPNLVKINCSRMTHPVTSEPISINCLTKYKLARLSKKIGIQIEL